MTARPDVRRRAGESRCDVCWGGPVQAVCSVCHRRLCRAHDAILDPVGVLPFGRAARIRRTAWALATAPGPAGKEAAGARSDLVDADDEDDEPVTRRSGRRKKDKAASKEEDPGSTKPSARRRRADEDRSGTRSPKVDDWRSARLPPRVARLLGPEWHVEREPEVTRAWDAADRQARPEDRHLCPEHAPADRWCDPEIVGAGATGALALGALASSATVVAGALGAVAAVRIGTRLTREKVMRRRRRELVSFASADPHIRRVRMTETISYRARLHPDQHYETTESTVRGAVEIDASWTRAAANVGARRARAAGVDTVTAAHVVLQGPGAFELDLTPEQEETGDSVVSLTPRAVGSDHLAGPWPVSVGYRPDPHRAAEAVDLWVTPTIGPESNRRVLELDISWSTRGEERYDAGLTLKKLDLVRVVVPTSWGRVEQPSNPEIATIAHDESGDAVVEWSNVRIEPAMVRGLSTRFRARDDEKDEKDVRRVTEGRTRGTIHLSLRMAREIPAAAALTARVEARFTGAVSGLTGAAVHYAGGGQRPEGRKPLTTVPCHSRSAADLQKAREALKKEREELQKKREASRRRGDEPEDEHDEPTDVPEEPPPDPQAAAAATLAATMVGYRNAAPTTRVVLDLDLSLAGLRYQARRSVPDRDEGEDEDATTVFTGTPPDHETVVRLVDRLSEGGYYVKRAVENRPQLGRSASTMTRSWDIGGRYYQGVYPIDFDILLTGDEPTLAGTGQALTRVKLDVRGTYATPGMRERILDEHRNLQQVAAAVLSAPPPASSSAPDLDTLGEPVGDIRAALRRATRLGRITAAQEGALLRHVDTVFAGPEDR